MEVAQCVGFSTWSGHLVSVSVEVIVVAGNDAEVKVSGILPGEVDSDDCGNGIQIEDIRNTVVVVAV